MNQGRSLNSSNPALEVVDLNIVVGGRRILTDASFTLHHTTLTGLIGANGAGKTTLLKAILGLIPHESGTIQSRNFGEHGRPSIGYVPQKINLDPDVPIRTFDLVELGINGRGLRRTITKKERIKRVEEALQSVGMSHLADRRVGLLSGGEQQRAMIAHALVGRPDLLLLDEPLANLDVRAENEVVQLLTSLKATAGLAILLSAHDLNPILEVVDQVIYLAESKLASGPTEEVVTTSSLSALYGHHVEVIRVNGRVVVVPGRDSPSHHDDDQQQPNRNLTRSQP
ncbi:MAG: metal ABC transporter ATP-binding protein [Acidimicrobiales bacterium]